MALAPSASGPRVSVSRSIATKRTLPVFKPPSGSLAVNCARRNRILGTYPYNPQKCTIWGASLYPLHKIRFPINEWPYATNRRTRFVIVDSPVWRLLFVGLHVEILFHSSCEISNQAPCERRRHPASNPNSPCPSISLKNRS